MSRIVQLTISYATVVGYFLAVTWGPAWHDHGSCCSHAHTGEHFTSTEDTPAGHASGHSHGHCCTHHHASCCVETQTARQQTPSQAPCQSPWHDDDCVVCQNLAHPPLAAPTIELVDAAEPVLDWVILSCPQAVASLPTVYDSRGPPRV